MACRSGVRIVRCGVPPPLRRPCAAALCRFVSNAAADDDPTQIHFRHSRLPHPLRAKPWENPDAIPKQEFNARYATTSNHIWTNKEIEQNMANLWQHRPQTWSDKFVHSAMYGLYRTFNFITGYRAENTAVRAVEWRLIVLESFAGVPGFVAAMFRHFKSLRCLSRDHGWIHTLLEEAENERMHLLTCMKMFKAGYLTRFLVIGAQLVMTPFVASLYIVKPAAAHRFVGYLEETACLTYANIIHQVETPGTPLNLEWSHLPAPNIAKTYWKLSDDAKWVDVLKCMFADECNHRDVNHTFATMSCDDPNPFVCKHQEDALKAWRLDETGGTTDLGCEKTLGTKAP